MGYHTIKTALQRVDDMTPHEKMMAKIHIDPSLNKIMYPVKHDRGVAHFEDGQTVLEGGIITYADRVYDARVPEPPPVRKDIAQLVEEAGEKTEAMKEPEEDESTLLLEEIIERHRRGDKLVAWVGSLIALLGLIAATESKWMPLLASVPWFKKAPAQIEGESISLGNLKVYNYPNSTIVTFERGEWLSQSNMIYMLGFEKAATASNCTIFYVPEGKTNLYALRLETENGEYHQRAFWESQATNQHAYGKATWYYTNGGTALKTP